MVKKKKHAGGRPSKYSKKYCRMLIEHFSVPKSERFIKSERIIEKKNGTIERFFDYGYRCADLPTFNRFAMKININGDTIVEWAKKYKEFSAAYNRAKQIQKEFLIDNALKSFSPPASFIFVAKNITDMRDKIESDITLGLKPTPILGKDTDVIFKNNSNKKAPGSN